MGLGPKGSLSGFLKNVRVQLKIRLNLLDAAVKLEKFEIVSLGTLSVDIKGLGVILNIIAETVTLGMFHLVVYEVLPDLFFMVFFPIGRERCW